jgi:serine protease inhibitor
MTKKVLSLRIFLVASIFLLMVVVFFAFFGNKNGDYFFSQVIKKEEAIDFSKEDIKSTVSGSNSFAFDLYQKINQDDSKNIFFSPYSVFLALSIVHEGAEGETAEEMKRVLYLPERDFLRSSIKTISSIVNRKGREYSLSTGNAIWTQKDYEFLEEYINIIEENYSAKATNLDFARKTELSRLTINDYIERETQGKIKDIISEGFLNPLTKMVITSAIYFKGDWKFQFEKEETREMEFYVKPEEKIKTEMMFAKTEDVRFNYLETEELEIIELPYKGESVSMLILLPKNDIKEIEKDLNFEKLESYKREMKETSIDAIYFPKFEFDTKYFMRDLLMSMGMSNAFIYGFADFSNIDGTKNLFIDNVIHQAYIGVDEKGSEAAGATAVILLDSVSEEKIFMANRPFLFIIEEKETGVVLFLGKLCNPKN